MIESKGSFHFHVHPKTNSSTNAFRFPELTGFQITKFYNENILISTASSHKDSLNFEQKASPNLRKLAKNVRHWCPAGVTSPKLLLSWVFWKTGIDKALFVDHETSPNAKSLWSLIWIVVCLANISVLTQRVNMAFRCFSSCATLLKFVVLIKSSFIARSSKFVARVGCIILSS